MVKKHGFVLDEDVVVPSVSSYEKEQFVKGIKNHTATNEQRDLDPKEKPTYGINVRFNQYQMNLIRKVCKQEERSQQQIIKRILIPALEQYVGKLDLR